MAKEKKTAWRGKENEANESKFHVLVWLVRKMRSKCTLFVKISFVRLVTHKKRKKEERKSKI